MWPLVQRHHWSFYSLFLFFYTYFSSFTLLCVCMCVCCLYLYVNLQVPLGKQLSVSTFTSPIRACNFTFLLLSFYFLLFIFSSPILFHRTHTHLERARQVFTKVTHARKINAKPAAWMEMGMCCVVWVTTTSHWGHWEEREERERGRKKRERNKLEKNSCNTSWSKKVHMRILKLTFKPFQYFAFPNVRFCVATNFLPLFLPQNVQWNVTDAHSYKDPQVDTCKEMPKYDSNINGSKEQGEKWEIEKERRRGRKKINRETGTDSHIDQN